MDEAVGLRRRLRNGLFSLLLLVVALSIALLLAEGLIRIVRPQQLVSHRPDIYRPLDTVGFAQRPDVHTTISTGERTVELFTDSEGYRVGVGGRVEADTRVLILGDSFMQALQVDFERSVAGILEAELPGLLGQPVAVRNAAVSDWQPSQYALQARQSLAREEFGFVIVGFFVNNDVVRKQVDHIDARAYSPTQRLRFPRSLDPEEIRLATLVPISDYLAARSHLFALTKNASRTLRIQLGLSRAVVPKVVQKDFADSPDWGVSADICATIAELAAAQGARTLVLLIPAVEQVDRERFEASARAFRVDTARIDIDQPNRILRRELEARGVEVVDLLPVLREAQDTGGDLYGRIDWHLTPRGNEVVASYLLPIVAERLAAASGADADPPAPGVQ